MQLLPVDEVPTSGAPLRKNGRSLARARRAEDGDADVPGET